jgi:hypothetical protein
MNAGQLAADITAVQAVSGTILTTIAAVDPAVAVPAETAQALVALLGTLISAALTAAANASGVPITVASVQALGIDDAPLPVPATD